jgi:hypothetical protein
VESNEQVELVVTIMAGLLILLIFLIGVIALLSYAFTVINKRVGVSLKEWQEDVRQARPHIIDAVSRYPDIQLAHKATHRQLGIWFRFLPSPANDEQREVLRVIIDRFNSFGGFNPNLSKDIGWNLQELIKRTIDSEPST